MASVNVEEKNQDRNWARMYDDIITYLKPPIPVRTNKSKGVLTKGYMPNLSKEHFTIDDDPDP